MKTEWRDAEADYPRWEHAGKDVEAVLEDGNTVTGWLLADAIDETEEVPLFEIMLPDNTDVSFVRVRKWRLLTRS